MTDSKYLSPLEKFRLLKQGVLPPTGDTPPAKDTSPEDVIKSPSLRANASISPRDPDANYNDPQGTPNPKRLDQPCDHPKDRRRTEHGRHISSITVCGDCGRIVNDPDLR